MPSLPRPAVLELIGNTPLVRVSRFDTGPCTLFLKLESQNPGGSIKDRIGLAMIDAADPKVRLAAAQTLQKTAQPAQLKFLDQQVASETNEDVHTALSLALANLQLVDTDPAVRLAAVRLLGNTGDPLARTRLEALLAPGVETDAAVHTAAETSLAQVKRKLMLGEILGQAFSGMSLGSILLLSALGLAITFGLLGVINMAHGEYASIHCNCFPLIAPS